MNCPTTANGSSVTRRALFGSVNSRPHSLRRMLRMRLSVTNLLLVHQPEIDLLERILLFRDGNHLAASFNNCPHQFGAVTFRIHEFHTEARALFPCLLDKRQPL